MTREYSFEAWKEEKSIDLICEKLLDNADMDMSISAYPLVFVFTFFVVGSDIKVIFRCSEIESLELKKESTEEAMFVVLETHVRRAISKDSWQEMWVISILPFTQFNIECRKFEWSLEQITEPERRMLND